TGTHQIDGTRVDGADTAEIQGFGAGDLSGMPSDAVVSSREPGAAAAAGKHRPGIHGAYTAQRSARVADLRHPGLRADGGCEEQGKHRPHGFTMVVDCTALGQPVGLLLEALMPLPGLLWRRATWERSAARR